MSLGNAISFVVNEEEFYNTPSRKEGIDELTEFDLRVYGCELIQEAGILLKMCAACPQAMEASNALAGLK